MIRALETMMKYVFKPANLGAMFGTETPKGQKGGVGVRPGDVSECSDEYAKLIITTFKGIDGEACLVPVDPVEAPKVTGTPKAPVKVRRSRRKAPKKGS